MKESNMPAFLALHFRLFHQSNSYLSRGCGNRAYKVLPKPDEIEKAVLNVLGIDPVYMTGIDYYNKQMNNDAAVVTIYKGVKNKEGKVLANYDGSRPRHIFDGLDPDWPNLYKADLIKEFGDALPVFEHPMFKNTGHILITGTAGDITPTGLEIFTKAVKEYLETPEVKNIEKIWDADLLKEFTEFGVPVKKSTMNKFAHREAFCHMQYAGRTARGTISLMIWNSRDGVTPFCTVSKEYGIELQHVNSYMDKVDPDYKPKKGDLIWASYDEESARIAGEKSYESAKLHYEAIKDLSEEEQIKKFGFVQTDHFKEIIADKEKHILKIIERLLREHGEPEPRLVLVQEDWK